MDVFHATDHLGDLVDGAGAVNRHAEHLAEHRDADLETDAREKADQHGLREEVGEEAELE